MKLINKSFSLATDETRLREEFQKFGTISDIFLPVDRNTNRPRGFGFVTFTTRKSAEEAITRMDQSEVDGRTLRVNESKPRSENRGGDNSRGFNNNGGFNAAGKEEVKMYVGNLSFDTFEDSLRGVFEQYGTVTDCFLPTDRETGKPRGFAFVTMASAEAEEACNKVNGQELDGRTLRVNEAQEKGGRGGGGRGGGRGGGYGGGGYGGGRGGGGYRGGRGYQ